MIFFLWILQQCLYRFSLVLSLGAWNRDELRSANIPDTVGFPLTNSVIIKNSLWVLWPKAATQALLGADSVVSDERLGLSGWGEGPAGLWSHVHRLWWWWEMRMWTEGLWAFWTPEWLTGERGIHRTLKHMPLAIIFIWYIWKAPLHGRKRGGWSLFQKCSNKKRHFHFENLWESLKNISLVCDPESSPSPRIVFILLLGDLPRWLRQWRICLQCSRPRFDPWVRKIPWRRAWQPTLVFLPGEFHGQRSLVGYSPWGWKRINMTWVTDTFTLENYTARCFHLDLREA